MATSRFVRRNTTVDLDIEGNKFRVDFSGDDIPAIISEANKRTTELEEAHEDITDIRERRKAIDAEQKIVIENAINELLQDPSASEKIFESDQSSMFHADVYTYITGEYYRVISADISPYSANRAQRTVGK